jgi:poly(3-hydroxybutyrate) depolymerase
MRNAFGTVLLCGTFAAMSACSDSLSETSGGRSATSGGQAGSGGTTSGGAGQSTSGSGGMGGITGGTGGATGGTGGTTGGTGGTTGGTGGTTGGSGGTTGGSGGTTGGSGGSSTPMDASADTSVGRDASFTDANASRDGDASIANDVSRDAGRPSKPSAGCGKLNPPMGNRTIMTGGQTATFIVRLPTGYDAMTPMPLGLGFHGNGNPACLPPQGECQGFPDLKAITVYPKSLAAGWEQSAVLEPNITFFNDLVALMKNEYCVDENRIFVAGVSSGGQFVEHLTCRFGDWLWQVTPVCAGVVNAATMNCKGTPPILVIHGVTDMAGNYGDDVVAQFARRNGCSMTPPAGLTKARADMQAAFMAMQAQHVCLDWEGCTANPVRFCISSQITYSGLTHGWPKVGGTLIADFQSGLP